LTRNFMRVEPGRSIMRGTGVGVREVTRNHNLQLCVA
jgi:hypothetical protein